jgi:hypothetical protein
VEEPKRRGKISRISLVSSCSWFEGENILKNNTKEEEGEESDNRVYAVSESRGEQFMKRTSSTREEHHHHRYPLNMYSLHTDQECLFDWE